MLYHSTRGQAPEMDFQGVTMTGLATDGGLYLPKVWPTWTPNQLQTLQGLSYQETVCAILAPFVAPSLTPDELKPLVAKAYATFTHPDIAPLRPLGENRWLLELFHGPTLAFKDIALQLLGHLFEHFLAKSGQRITVLGATSGDTGSAAIAATAGRKGITTFILYPHGGTSDVQRRQMTCVQAPNVHAIAVKGSFDDCQALVKALFNEPATRATYNLAAVNSINWARLLAQIVYYVFAALRLGAPEQSVSFVVPTGNFGNLYAAESARRIGLSVARLGVATNSNDILARFFTSGVMQTATVIPTLSPSMDIQISSNFERLLFDACNEDSEQVRGRMHSLASPKGSFEVGADVFAALQKRIVSTAVNDDETVEEIKRTYGETGLILDPHTAVGVRASRRLEGQLSGPTVVLATAHPAKFPETIRSAIGIDPPLPEALAQSLNLPERTSIIPAEPEAVKALLASRTESG